MSASDTFRLGSLTATYTTTQEKPCPIGTVWKDEINQKKYMFCYNAGATTWTVGVPIAPLLTMTAPGQASFTAATQLLLADGGTDSTAVIGLALGTAATTVSAWVQIWGLNAACVTDGNVDASEGIYCADNGIVSLPVTEPTHMGRFGVCIIADASGAGGIIATVMLDRTIFASF